MRGASRASLAEAAERLAAAMADGAPSRQLGDELFAVAHLLDTEPRLRRMLSDPARETGAKTGLVEALLGEKISATALDQVTGLVSARWSAAGDLAAAAEQMAVLAFVEMADEQGKLDDLEDELFRFARLVNAEPALRVALSNPFVAAERKRELIDSLLTGKVTEPTLRLVTEAAVHPRGRSLDTSLESYAALAAGRRERMVAEVHVAVGLTAARRRRLAAALSAAYGHDVHLNIVLDPAVIGGMSIRIGDELIDGSMASRLAELRRKLGGRLSPS